MRKLMLVLMLLLLLPLALGINVQADETDPPPDPGTEDGGGEDIEGDHPWGGNDNVIVVEPDLEPDPADKITLSFTKYFQIFLYTNYGIDLFESSTKTSSAFTTRRLDPRKTYSSRYISVKRSRR